MIARKMVCVVAMACVAALAAPVAAGAQTTAHVKSVRPAATTTSVTSLRHIPVSGQATNGKAFQGHLNVTQFVRRHGATYALGTLTGRLGTRTIKARQVAVPASVPKPLAGLTGNASAAAVCPVLHLTLGPLHLNLLGLHVNLNQVVLGINAQSGSGQLLGNLLCSVSNLLNTQSILGSQLTGLLNLVQTLLNNPALSSL